MGKIFKFVAMATVCAFTASSFAGCDDDDENDSKGNNNNQPKTEFVSKTFSITLPCASVTGNYWTWINKEEAAADSVNRFIQSVDMGPDIATSLEADTWTFKTKEKGVNVLKFRYGNLDRLEEARDTTFTFEK